MDIEEFMEGKESASSIPEEDLLAHAKSQNRPYVIAEMGMGLKQIIYYPPKEFAGASLTAHQLVDVIRKYRVLPSGVDYEMMFISWDELRLIFGRKVDKYLVETFNIFPTENPKEKKDA